MRPKRTTNDFINRSNHIHNFKYDYSKCLYFHKDKKVKIICPIHGEFEQIAHSHMRGTGCKKCSKISPLSKTTQQFIKEAKLIHGDRYDYSLVEYKNNKTKIIIICPMHGEFEQTPGNHLNGANCSHCSLINYSKKKKKNINDFINESNHIHNFKYDYSLVDYINSHIKIKIICPIHGEFQQKPYAHLKGQGCNNCCNILKKENAPSWTITNWINAAKRSLRFDSFKLYVIECFNENEKFIKIGRTFCTLNVRFYQLPYNYRIIKIIENNDAKHIYNLEIRIKRKFKPYKYIPLIKFGGMNECYFI